MSLKDGVISHVIVLGALVLSAATVSLAQPQKRPRITGIHHVGFRVTDAPAARRFYADILGLTERAAPGGSRIRFDIGSRQHVLLEPSLAPSDDERLSHVAFETPDVKALAAYLIGRGVDVTQPAERCVPGAIRVKDPAGHTIEFVQVPWPASPKIASRSQANEGGPPDPPRAEAGRALSNRLLHAGVIVRDEQAAHRFYRETLGFSEIWRGGRTEGITNWVNMRVPDGTDYLEYMLVTTSPDRRQRGVFHHICLLVPDIQTAWETVVRRFPGSARALLAPPNVGVNGRWQLNLYDPDGTRTELMEPFTIR